eukprot:PITA_29016
MCYVAPDYISDSSRTRDYPEDNHKFCNDPGIFTGFSAKGSSDSDGAKSPTSLLDIKTFSGIGITDFHENDLDIQSISPKKHSDTIPIGSPHGFTKSHTCVISCGSNSSTNNLYTRTGTECEIVQYPVRNQNGLGIWDVASPPRSYSNVLVFSVGYFLSACCLCKLQLNHGKDIYMYRGDKAFCSVECWYQQILMDDGMSLTIDFDDLYG